MDIDQWQPTRNGNLTKFASAQRKRDWLALMRMIQKQMIRNWVLSMSTEGSQSSYDPLKPYTWPSL